MVVAILAAGIWGIWKALVQRRYTETAGALGLSVVFVLLALFFVYQPERTVGQASQWTNTLSLAFLSGANRGIARRSRAGQAPGLRSPLRHARLQAVGRARVRRPVALRRHRPPRPRRLPAPGRARRPRPRRLPRPHHPEQGRLRRLRRALPRRGTRARRNAPRSCRPRSRNGERPVPDQGSRARTRTPIKVDKADAPAVDIQQEGGAFQRLTFSALVFIGALGAVALLGFLSLAVILAQVVALVLLGFAPVALIIGIFPGAGHAFFRGWLTKLATAIFIKALYSLVIAIVVAVSAALTAAHRLARVPVRLRAADDLLLGDLPLPQADRQPPRRRHHRRRRRRVDARAWAPSRRARRPRPSPSPRSPASASPAAASRRASSPSPPPSTPSSTSSTSTAARRTRRPSPHRAAEPPTRSTSNGDSRSSEPGVRAAAADRVAELRGTSCRARRRPTRPPSIAASRPAANGDQAGRAPEPTPRSSHEDVMQRARELRERQREAVPASEWDRA